MRRLALLAVMTVQVAVMVTIAPVSASAAKQACPAGQKVCLTVGEPPALGVYRFSQSSSGPNQSHAGRLSVRKTTAGYAVSDVRMWLGQKEGCGLGDQLAVVESVSPLIKKTKFFAIGSGKAEKSLTWRLPHRTVRVKVGGKSYPGNLSASFLSPPPGSGAPPNVEGHLTLTSSEGAVCGGYFAGTHRGKS
jgi:hypothetical protein